MLNKRKNNPAVLLAAAAASLLVLSGCSMFRSDKAPAQPRTQTQADGSKIIFPTRESASFKEGTFVNIENLRRVIPGLTKPQLYDLLGPPHFSEGVFSVHTWNYIFNFRTGKGNEYVTCQYQIQFDKDMRAESGNWDRRECADFVFPKPPPAPAPVVVPVPPPPPAPAPARKVTLSADALFAFGKSDLGSISSAGRRRLDDLSRELKAVDVERIRVIGHADRIGSASYNDRLSEERAATVVRYLVGAGVPSRLVSSEGRGSREPVVQCSQSARAALIECLAPNRRVEVEINGKSGS